MGLPHILPHFGQGFGQNHGLPLGYRSRWYSKNSPRAVAVSGLLVLTTVDTSVNSSHASLGMVYTQEEQDEDGPNPQA